MIGPDGKRYPTWHPPTVVDPATGGPCTFGHEHGRDPAGSDLVRVGADHFAAPGTGLRGHAVRARDRGARHLGRRDPATPTRQEDHVGYKVD